eukprot:3550821-Pleurochrysis_carterae.AAC.5
MLRGRQSGAGACALLFVCCAGCDHCERKLAPRAARIACAAFGCSSSRLRACRAGSPARPRPSTPRRASFDVQIGELKSPRRRDVYPGMRARRELAARTRCLAVWRPGRLHREHARLRL